MKAVVSGVALTVLIAAALAYIGSERVNGTDDFPPFELRYEARAAAGGTVVSTLKYTSRRDWRDTVLFDSLQPERAGSYRQAVGDDLEVYSAVTNSTEVVRGRGQWVPGPWLLSPSAAVARAGEALVSDTSFDGRREVVVEQELPCESPEREAPGGTSAPGEVAPAEQTTSTAGYPCAGGATSLVVRSTYVFDADSGVPLSVTDSADGSAIRSLTARDFRVYD